MIGSKQILLSFFIFSLHRFVNTSTKPESPEEIALFIDNGILTSGDWNSQYPLSWNQILNKITVNDMENRMGSREFEEQLNKWTTLNSHGNWLDTMWKFEENKNETTAYFNKLFWKAKKKRSAFIAEELSKAVSNKLNSVVLAEILVTTSNIERDAIGLNPDFCEKLRRKKEVTRNYKVILLAMCKNGRNEFYDEWEGEIPEIDKIASEMHLIVSNPDKISRLTENSPIITALTTYSYPFLRFIFREYKKNYGESIECVVEKLSKETYRFSTHTNRFFELLYLIIIDVQCGRPQFFARLLLQNLRKLRKSDVNLYEISSAIDVIDRILLTRAQVDLADINQEFVYLPESDQRSIYNYLDEVFEFQSKKIGNRDLRKLHQILEIIRAWKQILLWTMKRESEQLELAALIQNQNSTTIVSEIQNKDKVREYAGKSKADGLFQNQNSNRIEIDRLVENQNIKMRTKTEELKDNGKQIQPEYDDKMERIRKEWNSFATDVASPMKSKIGAHLINQNGKNGENIMESENQNQSTGIESINLREKNRENNKPEPVKEKEKFEDKEIGERKHKVLEETIYNSQNRLNKQNQSSSESKEKRIFAQELVRLEKLKTAWREIEEDHSLQISESTNEKNHISEKEGKGKERMRNEEIYNEEMGQEGENFSDIEYSEKDPYEQNIADFQAMDQNNEKEKAPKQSSNVLEVEKSEHAKNKKERRSEEQETKRESDLVEHYSEYIKDNGSKIIRENKGKSELTEDNAASEQESEDKFVVSISDHQKELPFSVKMACMEREKYISEWLDKYFSAEKLSEPGMCISFTDWLNRTEGKQRNIGSEFNERKKQKEQIVDPIKRLLEDQNRPKEIEINKNAEENKNNSEGSNKLENRTSEGAKNNIMESPEKTIQLKYILEAIENKAGEKHSKNQRGKERVQIRLEPQNKGISEPQIESEWTKNRTVEFLEKGKQKMEESEEEDLYPITQEDIDYYNKYLIENEEN